MGIKGFREWLIREFPKSKVPCSRGRDSECFDHVLVDMNGFLHTKARTSDSLEELISKLFKALHECLKLCSPRQTLLLAFDGPASMAKMVTQRKRRRQLSDKKERKAAEARGERQPPPPQPQSAEEMAAAKRRKKRKKKKGLDSLMFTPGTKELQLLKEALEYFGVQLLQQSHRYRNVCFVLSGADSEGEGEQKLLNWMLQGPQRHPEESYAIIGSDADLVLMGLASQVKNLFILGDLNDGYVLSNWELCRSLDRSLPGQCPRVRHDFVLLSLLQGNDYLPKLRGVTMSRVWARYLKLKRGKQFASSFLMQPSYGIGAGTGALDWPFFFEVLKPFRRGAPDIEKAVQQTERRTKQEEEERERTVADLAPGEDVVVFDPAAFRKISSSTSQTSSSPLDESESESESEDSYDEVSDEDIPVRKGRKALFDVANYIEALLWCHAMYSQGYCPDYTFRYRFRYAPNVAVLLATPVAELATILLPYAPQNLPLPPLMFAMSLLPYDARGHLPDPLQALTEKSSPIADIYHGKASRTGTVDVERIRSAVMDFVAANPSSLTGQQHALLNFQQSVAYVSGQHPVLRSGDRSAYGQVPTPRPPVSRFSTLRSPSHVYATALDMSKASGMLLPWPPEHQEVASQSYFQPYRNSGRGGHQGGRGGGRGRGGHNRRGRGGQKRTASERSSGQGDSARKRPRGK